MDHRPDLERLPSTRHRQRPASRPAHRNRPHHPDPLHLEHDHELVPYATTVEDRYTNWLAQQHQNGVTFTDTQRWWLDRIKDTIIQTTHITIDDLDLAPFTERGGIDGAGRDLGPDAQTLIDDLNTTLAA